MSRRDVEDDDEAYDVTPLNGAGPRRHVPDGYGGSTCFSVSKLPWVILGISLGLCASLAVPVRAASEAGAAAAATTCGAVPTDPPQLMRRPLDGQVRNVLVTGGAGFIASHFALALLDRTGFNVTVVDDLSRGSIETILRLQVRLLHTCQLALQAIRTGTATHMLACFPTDDFSYSTCCCGCAGTRADSGAAI
jgi:hypothetical protein